MPSGKMRGNAVGVPGENREGAVACGDLQNGSRASLFVLSLMGIAGT